MYTTRMVFILYFVIPLISYAAQTAVTGDGRTVILDDDGTWKYQEGTTSMPKPSTTSIRNFLNHKWGKELSQGMIQILHVQKTNGQSAEIGGIQLYNIEYEALVRYPKGVNTQCLKQRREKQFFGPCPPGVKIFAVGEAERIQDKITFELTERGWRGPDGQIYE